MLQLVYMSTAPTPPTPAEITALCEQATRNNRRDEITGVLLAHGSTFLQALEGPREAVENTFLRIIVDDRHASVTLLRRTLTCTREFGDWSMAEVDDADEQRCVIERVRSVMADAPVHLQRAFARCFLDDDVAADDRPTGSSG